MYIKYLLLLSLLTQIFSISGTDEEIYNLTEIPEPTVTVDLNNPCSCDLTMGVCDSNCCCDNDCTDYLRSQTLDRSSDVVSNECFKDSYSEKIEGTFINFCKEYPKTLDDLYNPLIIGFHLFKTGFCLFKDNRKTKDKNFYGLDNDKDLNQKYEKEIEEIENNEKKEALKSGNYEKVLPVGESGDKVDYKDYLTYDIIENFNVPVSLSNGLCLFEAYPIKFNQNYEVLCSYYGNIKGYILNLANKLSSKEINYYKIQDNYYINTTETDITPKKIEIMIYSKENKINNVVFNYFYYDPTEDNSYKDFTFSVIFLTDEKDYLKSGNPGYIKGKKILMGEENSTTTEEKNDFRYINLYKEGSIISLPFENGTCVRSNNITKNDSSEIYFYYDHFIDNVFTFEDTIIYGCNKSPSFSGKFNEYFIYNIINTENDKISKVSFGKFGNANIRYINDWQKIQGVNFWEKEIVDDEYNQPVYYGIYKEKGAVNNTQYAIDSIRIDRQKTAKESKNLYFLSKFLKYNNTETKWWYAPGPGFIRLPKNIMYPFKIGTTTYREKN